VTAATASQNLIAPIVKIDNRSQMQNLDATSLDSLAVGDTSRIAAIDWSAMGAAEGQRLREFGLIEGADLTVLHRGTLISRDPLALLVGRMRVMIRSAQARHILVGAVEPAT
jgi:ferrous iron transport protein A